jgi:hypothetical protein
MTNKLNISVWLWSNFFLNNNQAQFCLYEKNDAFNLSIIML